MKPAPELRHGGRQFKSHYEQDGAHIIRNLNAGKQRCVQEFRAA